jgi:hypothetical protein
VGPHGIEKSSKTITFGEMEIVGNAPRNRHPQHLSSQKTRDLLNAPFLSITQLKSYSQLSLNPPELHEPIQVYPEWYDIF